MGATPGDGPPSTSGGTWDRTGISECTEIEQDATPRCPVFKWLTAPRHLRACVLSLALSGGSNHGSLELCGPERPFERRTQRRDGLACGGPFDRRREIKSHKTRT